MQTEKTFTLSLYNKIIPCRAILNSMAEDYFIIKTPKTKPTHVCLARIRRHLHNDPF